MASKFSLKMSGTTAMGSGAAGDKVFWTSIVGGPTAAPSQIDLAASRDHVHGNKDLLDSISVITEDDSTFISINSIVLAPRDGLDGLYNEMSIRQQVDEDLKGQLSATLAQLNMLQAMYRAMTQTDVVTINTLDDAELNQADKDLVINADAVFSPENSKATINAASVTIEKMSVADATVAITATKDVAVQGFANSGTVAKSVSNAQLNIPVASFVTVQNSTFNATGYNVIEVGITSPAKSVIIDGVTFNGVASNNTISIHNTESGSVVTISNCKFGKCSNALRFSNMSGGSLRIDIINCEFTEWNEGGEYAGMIIFQDFTSKSAAAAAEANLFGKDKIVVNIQNCTYKGMPITFENEADVCPGGELAQLFYVYRDKGGLVPYGDGSAYPTFVCLQ